MSIVIIYKSVAVCSGEQWSLNLLLFTVWSLSVQWTAPLFLTIVPHSLKHLSLKWLQRQINCHWEFKPANWGNGKGYEDTRFYMKSKRSSSHSGRLLWKVDGRLPGWRGTFWEFSRKAKDTFSFINGTFKAFSIRHLREPNVQNSKGLPGEGEISQMSTSVKTLSV